MVGLRVKKYLDDNGIKYSYVAEKINMPMNMFSPLLNGKRKMTAEEYLLICQAIGVDAGYFSDDPEPIVEVG
ncbi:MAG: helix-turn-helix transcriptional regulator [Eubacterium sp.]|nr:helix-turn-helix transcriptional regulator [Eubacterium sp.]